MNDEGVRPEPDSVDEYMQKVGRFFYEVIRDWMKKQEERVSVSPEPELPRTQAMEGSTQDEYQ